MSDDAQNPSPEKVEVFEASKSGYKRVITRKQKPAVEPTLKQPQPPPAQPPKQVKPTAVPPKPAPVKPAKIAMPTNPDGHGKLVAESMVSGFVAAMNAQAAKRGGHLLPEDIQMLSASFEKQTDKIASTISRSISVYAESHSQTQWDPERVNAFDRVLVKQFSKLLSDDEIVAKKPEAISRRVLHGMFAAVRMIAGPERIEQYEQDAYLVMQRVRDDKREGFTWDTVYADPRTKNMLRDLLVFLAPHFINVDRRIDWMLGVVNGHLSPVSPSSPVVNWRVTPRAMFRIIDSLFDELRQSNSDELIRSRMAKQFGDGAMENVTKLLWSLKKYRSQLG